MQILRSFTLQISCGSRKLADVPAKGLDALPEAVGLLDAPELAQLVQQELRARTELPPAQPSFSNLQSGHDAIVLTSHNHG